MGAVIGLACLGIRRPRVALLPEHGPAPWPRRWPLWVALGIGLVVGLSILTIGPDGRLGVQDRWSTAFHRFTWGAKIEALQPPPQPEFLKAER